MQNQIQVTVICDAFNHAPYIRNTLDHFVNQRVNFPFEILIHDDASTDGTAEIIREYAEKYPELLVPILQKENQYSKGVAILNTELKKVRGKYIAFCEGDDHWPDLDKLQKQYDFLESHPEYSGVAGVTEYFDDDGNVTMSPMPSQRYANKDASEWAFLNEPEANIGSNTLMVRSAVLLDEAFYRAKEESTYVGDILIMLKTFEAGKIFIFEDVFQYHLDQTRTDASNYNTIFNWEKKFSHCVDVCNAIANNFEGEHDLTKWIENSVFCALVRAMRTGEKKRFMELYRRIPSKYRVSLIGVWLKHLPGRVKALIKRRIFKDTTLN